MWKSEQAVRSVGGRNNAIMIIWTELPNIIYHCLASQHSRTTTQTCQLHSDNNIKTYKYHSLSLWRTLCKRWGIICPRRSIVGVSPGIKRVIDVSVMTGSACCYAGLRCLCQTLHVHWSFHLLCNCRVGMTYVRIVPSFITHSQLLATTGL